MERAVADTNILDTFVKDFVAVVEPLARYIIVSGFVAISHGRMRGTEDIDMILERLEKDTFKKLHEALVQAGFECVQSSDATTIYEYLTSNTAVRYVRKGTFVPEMEVKFAKDALDDDQLKRRVKLPLSGLDVWFSSIETNIAFKEELLKSPKDLEDAAHLRRVYEGELDEEEIERVKALIRRLRL